MEFERFGVTLERLSASRLEAVRTWRNSEWVRPYMRQRTVISPADQARWFAGLDARCNWYFVARLGRQPFGLFHVKEIDWSRRCGEAGGFVGHPAFLGTPEAACATLALMDFAFLLLDLDALEAHYLASLPQVVRFNAQLGYRVLDRDAAGFVHARVSAAGHFTAAAAVRTGAARLYGDRSALTDPDPWLVERLAQASARARSIPPASGHPPP